MQLLAGSLNVEVDGFLHPGYLSAYPRSFTSMGGYQLTSATVKVIDVKKALELNDSKARPESSAVTEASSPAPPPASMVSDTFMLVIAFFFFAYLADLYCRRIRKLERSGWRPWVWSAVPLLLLVVLVYSAVPAYRSYSLHSLPPPWKGVPVRNYKNPEAATQTILHGLIANALPGCGFEVRGLAAIQKEVAFPVPAAEHTPGMAYALKTYGRDGWGRIISFQPLAEGRYRIASAGPDGTHGTKDDIVVATHAKNGYDWENRVNGLYVRPAKREDACFIHRISHSNFKRAHASEARKLTGTDLFDTFSFRDLLRDHDLPNAPHPVCTALEKYRDSHPAEGEAEPLLFVQVDRPKP